MRRKSKRRKADRQDSPDRWLVSYADFITLLFAFFTILFATSQQDVDKAKQFENSIKQFLIKFGAFGGTGDEVNQGKLENSLIKQPIQTFPQGSKKAKMVQRKVEIFLESQLTEEELEKTIKDVSQDAYGVKIRVSANDIFAFNSSKFRARSVKTLNKLARLIKNSKERIVVEGHTDNLPLKNSKFPSHWELGAKRATAIIRYFVKIHKIDASRFVATSYGSQRPIVPNSNKKNRNKNQRIDFLLLTEDSPI